MYESFFNLNARPFEVAPKPSRYFPATAIEHARETLSRCVSRAEGPGLLIGPSGTGKTTLCHVLANQFADSFRVAMLAGARLCTRKALLQSILFELQLPYKDMGEGDLRLSLMDYLEPGDNFPNGLLLIVDEADTLPLRLLEEIRIIGNLIRDEKPRVNLVLAGCMRLEERFASPKLESFAQRIAARCYTHPLSVDETASYVRSQISSVAGDPDQLFTRDAFTAIHQASDGIPRLVNQICDHSLIMAAAGGKLQVDAAGIEEAWADLQQLPAPWTPLAGDDESSESGDSVVEFGDLDGGVDQLPVGSTLDLVESPDGHLLKVVSNEDAPNEDVAVAEPEVELGIFGDESPFDESFQDEEVVVDNVSALSSSATTAYEELPVWEIATSDVDLNDHVSLGEHTDVNCNVGENTAAEEIAAEVAAEMHESVEPEEVVAVDEVSPVESDDEFESVEEIEDIAFGPVVTPAEAIPAETIPAVAMNLDPADDPVMPETNLEHVSAIGGADERIATIAAEAEDEHEGYLLKVAGMDDRDIINVVPGSSEPKVIERPSGRVKRQEYRQLFASLRRRSS